MVELDNCILALSFVRAKIHASQSKQLLLRYLPTFHIQQDNGVSFGTIPCGPTKSSAFLSSWLS